MRVEDVVEALKLRRSEKGLTQSEVADLIGWKRQQLSAYEAGQKVPGLDALQKWSDALDFSVTLVVGDQSQPEPSLARTIAHLARGWDNCTSDDRRGIEIVMDRWARVWTK